MAEIDYDEKVDIYQQFKKDGYRFEDDEISYYGNTYTKNINGISISVTVYYRIEEGGVEINLKRYIPDDKKYRKDFDYTLRLGLEHIQDVNTIVEKLVEGFCIVFEFAEELK